jgi:hypothetical protein
MAADVVDRPSLPASGRFYTVLLGAFLVVLSTTVPYLTLLNAFFMAGIFMAGMFSIYFAVMHYQIRLSYSDAFLFASLGGIAGGLISEIVGYLLIEFAGYRPGTESLMLLVGWVHQMAAGNPELVDLVHELDREAKSIAQISPDINLKDLLVWIVVSAGLYAPVTGLGGIFMVFRLKRQAAKSR